MTKEITVSIEEFTKYLLKKWKRILIVTLLGALSFLGIAVFAGKEVIVEPSEEYIYLSEQKKAIDDYMENSIMMKIDAQNVYYREMSIDNVQNVEKLENYVVSDEIWEELGSQISIEYLKEILFLPEENDSNVIKVVVRQSGEKECYEYSKYLSKKIQEFDQNCSVTIGEQECGADDSILMAQLVKKNLQYKVESHLEIAAAGYIIRVSNFAAVAVGAFFGAFIMMITLFFRYLFER